jgi:fatty acid CoA ligase FadD9
MRLTQMMAEVMRRYADRPALGERARTITRDARTGRTSLSLLPSYDTTTFGELWTRVRTVADELSADPAAAVAAGDRVALLGFASRDYTTIDLACICLGGVTVPLQTSSPVPQLVGIVAETGPRVLAAAVDQLDTAIELVLAGRSVRRVVVFDHHAAVDDHRDAIRAARDRLAAAGREVAVEPLPEILDRGAALPRAPLFRAADGDDPMTMLVYTSGSTGAPKGAVYTERLVAAMFGGDGWSELFSENETVTFHYMPMSHVAGHSSVKNTLARGGTSYFTASSDLSTFFEDIALVRPTELSLVPRVCEALHQHHRSEVDRRMVAGADRGAVEEDVKVHIREQVLGGRVAWASCGSAPLSAELRAFVESLLDLELHIIYGTTEVAGVSVDGAMMRPPVIDYKLVDVPELGFYRTDIPYPRGELLLRTESAIPGYYEQAALTAEVFDAEGYYRTGDIVAEVAPDRVEILDRRNSVLKLSQGEFVATANLEAVFGASELVRQLFVYGNSERSHLLAVVVPAPDILDRYAAAPGELRQRLGESFQRIAKDAGLNSYEIPRDFLIEAEPFSQANGLLSDHRKLLRPRLLARYREELEAMYAAIARRESDALLEVRRTGADRPVLETVLRAARALLPGLADEVAPVARFRDLGGDSLSAVSYSDLLHDVFGVRVPVDVLVSPATDLRQVADYLTAKRGAALGRPTFDSVHGPGSTEVRAADLTLDKFLDEGTVSAAARLPRPAETPRTVLLTGASGYLGRFLCLGWLERLAPVGGKVICVVRGRDAHAAASRLDQAFAGGDSGPAARVAELAPGSLEVLAGDIAEPRLGLDEETWDRLSGEVDLIVHAGAMVNHVLPYDHLFQANVLGTAEVIRLALTGRMKPVTYVSSVAVATARAGEPPLDEDADVRTSIAVQTTEGGYADGYAASKWAGEVLLREAYDLCGLPSTVFRSSMILAHSTYGGQVNIPDVFTRLLFSIIATGIAPRSFYRTDASAAHYDGLPVDFTAAAIVGLGGLPGSGARVFSLVNPHDDGISLDTFVGWLTEAGHRIERVEDYADWLSRFGTAMRALPERQRQRSALPLLHRFESPEEVVPGSAIPSDRFRAAVHSRRIGPDGDIPHLSEPFIRKYATDLKDLLSA